MVLYFLYLSFEKTEKIPFENRAIFMRRVVLRMGKMKDEIDAGWDRSTLG